MANPEEWALVGMGNIGKEVIRQIGQPHIAERLGLSLLPAFIVRRSGIMEPDGMTPTGYSSLADVEDFPAVTFVALPSTDDGELAMNHISRILERPGTTVVTAEKGAIANNYTALDVRSDGFKRLGISPTIGGGTHMLEVAKIYCRDRENVSQIHLAGNGTLSSIFSLMGPRGEASGLTVGQAVNQSITMGYAEPGSKNPHDVIKKEAESDLPKKTAIFMNQVLVDEPLNWMKLRFVLEPKDIQKVVREAKIRRFIVSMYAANNNYDPASASEDDIIGGFREQHEGWHIVGGFQHIERNPLVSELARLTGPGNGVIIGLGPNEEDGAYTILGPGAGVSPTVNTMLDDWMRLKPAA